MSVSARADHLPPSGEVRLRRRLARVATEILAPWVWALAVPLAVAWQSTQTLGGTLLWGLVVGATGSIIPMIVIVRGARRGRWQGHHVTNREGRLVPLLTCAASLSVGSAILILGGAPDRMSALAASMLLTLIVGVGITFGLHWKVSLHAAVSAGGLITLMITYNPWLLLLAPLVGWVAWSRVELRDHTTGQVLVGLIIGITFGGGGFWLLDCLLR